MLFLNCLAASADSFIPPMYMCLRCWGMLDSKRVMEFSVRQQLFRIRATRFLGKDENKFSAAPTCGLSAKVREIKFSHSWRWVDRSWTESGDKEQSPARKEDSPLGSDLKRPKEFSSSGTPVNIMRDRLGNF